MKEIILSKETRLAKWYAFFWNKNVYCMPENTCTYYKYLVLSFLLIPFTHIGIIFNYFTKQKLEWFDKFLVTFSLWIVPAFLGIGISQNIKKLKFNFFNLWIHGFLMIFLTFLGITLIFFTTWGAFDFIKMLNEKFFTKKASTNKELSIIKSYYKQLKDKTCNKIKWI